VHRPPLLHPQRTGRANAEVRGSSPRRPTSRRRCLLRGPWVRTDNAL